MKFNVVTKGDVVYFIINVVVFTVYFNKFHNMELVCLLPYWLVSAILIYMFKFIAINFGTTDE